MDAIKVLIFVAGLAIVLVAITSAVRTFVVPRGAKPDFLTRAVFGVMRFVVVGPFLHVSRRRREIALTYFAPIALLTLPVAWLGCVLLGYTAIYFALGAGSWVDSIIVSRLSLLYLGANVNTLPAGTFVAFSETVLSLVLAAILVSYLPAIYGAFSQREEAVTGLETRAGAIPSPVPMLTRYHLIQGLDQVGEMWPTWQAWFETVEETHTALIPLVFYRSPQPHRSWITASGAVMDTAAFVSSTVDRPRDPQAELCIRAGYLCLRRIAVLFGIPFSDDPTPDDPISITRQEFEIAYEELKEVGVPLKEDRDRAWRDFRGWRVNYDAVLIGLAALTAAPPGHWSSDRFPRTPSQLLFVERTSKRAARAAMEGRLPEGEHSHRLAAGPGK